MFGIIKLGTVPQEPVTVFCEDCRWCIKSNSTYNDRCRKRFIDSTAEKFVRREAAERAHGFCDMTRGSERYCGESGKWFEPK
jgi:hypothetical protein